jgi:regulator of replication initiation timing
MTENLLQKLEDNVISLLAEMETLRNDFKKLQQENSTLRAEKVLYTQKLQGIVSQLDAMAGTVSISVSKAEVEY